MTNFVILPLFCTFAAYLSRKYMKPIGVFARVVVMMIIAAAIGTALFLCNSCKVTRTTTTESLYIHTGDTAAMIQTRTIETYDATKK